MQAVDIYPTLVDLCGLPRPGRLDGVSLKRLLDRPDASWGHAAFSVWSERGRWLSGVAVRDERWRYAESYGPGAGVMLLDSAGGPDEMRNLAGDPRHAAVVEKMSAAVRRYAAGLTESSPERAAKAP